VADVERCDAAESSDARRLMSCTLGGLSGVWHAAGVLADKLLPLQTAESLRRAYAPKAHGAWVVQQLSSPSVPLSACALFSSVVVLLGNAGQTNYGAANTCLDALAASRSTRGHAGVSVQWGPWAEVGMASGSELSALLKAAGFGLVGIAQGLAALQTAVRPCAPSIVGVVPMVWSRFLGRGVAAPAFLSAFVPKARAKRGAGGAAAVAAGRVISLEMVLELVRQAAVA
jgi:hypothetical protein